MCGRWEWLCTVICNRNVARIIVEEAVTEAGRWSIIH